MQRKNIPEKVRRRHDQKAKGELISAIVQVSKSIMTRMQTFLGQGGIPAYQQAYLAIENII